ncbi:MAG: LysM peptidoglycan-binding domain-containing protein [Saprospiraceae bacterium]|nr:LysM peptidoglycan-binding domain-containing protein [Saprospiraceae bacterium]
MITISILGLFSLVINQNQTYAQQITDAAFIKIDPKLGKVIQHRVLKNQTLYAIARGYGVAEESIINANPFLKGKKNRITLPPLLIIPVENNQIVARLPLFKNKNEYLPVYYQVKKKDNLFRISRVYFDIPTNLLSNRNELDDQRLNEGQVLHIGWLKKNFEPLIVHQGRLYEDEVKPDDRPDAQNEIRFRETMEGTSLVSKNEVAYWKTNDQAKGLFIMHRHAAKSSIIEINNPMYDRTVYAKVIGTIPPHLYPEEVDMVISHDIAKALGAVDPKFFVRSRYKSAHSISSR